MLPPLLSALKNISRSRDPVKVIPGEIAIPPFDQPRDVDTVESFLGLTAKDMKHQGWNGRATSSPLVESGCWLLASYKFHGDDPNLGMRLV